MNSYILLFLIISSIIYTESQDYTISEIFKNDKHGNAIVEKLLRREGIKKDKNTDYTCGVYDNDYNIIATASCFGNTLRCLAIDHQHQGKGLVNKIFSHLIQYQYERNNFHLFLYTKPSVYHLFENLGFYEIVKIQEQIVFMENKKTGFNDYLNELSKTKKERKKIASIIMKVNPFTLGHLHLIEKASKENDIVHIFIISEDKLVFPFDIRKRLVMEGTEHLKNIIYHDSGPYIISSDTFPGYFQKDEYSVIESHANIDLEIFSKIAKSLGINYRYFGEEDEIKEKEIYSKIMETKIPEYGINCIIVNKKKDSSGEIISTSKVRKLIKYKDFDKIKELVPESTYKYLINPESKEVIQKIKEFENI